MSRIDQIQSSGKRNDELNKTIDAINGYYSGFCRELGFDPNDRNRTVPNETERKRGETYFNRKTSSLRKEIQTYMKLGYSEEESLARVLPKAYGLVKAASAFLWNKPHYDVQLKGGILLNEGYASEMATGEGKTLTATLPTYLNALLGKGAHVITPNGYLAKRDFEEMSELYSLLGLTSGLIEERTSLDPEDIKKKTIAILGQELELYASAATTEAEREALIERYMSDRKNKVKVKEARQKAVEALRMEDTLKRRFAYDADITYGSSSAFAFDYLRDDIETDINKTVQRQGNPNFAVIDEVDAVLFDDATTPFTLSGEQTDEELAITEEERTAKMQKIKKANLAVAKINAESKTLVERYGREQALISHIKNDNEKYDAVLRNETKSANFQDMTRAIIINDSTQEYFFTTLGETMFFQFYCDSDINKILKEHLDEIRNIKFQDGPMYREGYDYVINEYGRIEMEPRAFAHLVTSGQIPELTQRFNRFNTNELILHRNEIDNAIKAWFVLEKDVDYILSKPNNPSTPDEQVVSLVMNGRTAEGRVYSNGLQQAIEEKIKYQKEINIRETKIKNTLASIPTASFFARYSKFGGMTGTSAVTAFRNLYSLETRTVERKKPKIVIDHGERMYASTEEKNEAIFQEVLKSYKKGQPVLLSTTSIEESEKLWAYLTKRLKEEGIEKEIPVLNANVDELEQEAAIVARAGMPRAITIATEMAGRGTDIKLGGEVPDVSDLVPIVADELVASTLTRLEKAGKVTKENRAQYEMQIKKKIYANRDSLEAVAQKRQDTIRERRAKLKEEVELSGGLKVIGSGHFDYTRVDDQVKGRCGRQGDPGEVIFFNDQMDLLRVGVPKEKVERLQKQAELSPIIEDPNTKRTPVSDAIYEAQSKTEGITETVIKLSQEIEAEISRYRRDFRAQKELLKENGDYVDTVIYLTEETVKSILVATSKIDTPNLTDKTKLHVAKLDLEELKSLSSEFLGIEMTDEEIKQFKNLGELREHMIGKSLIPFREKVEKEGKEVVNDECKEMVDKMFGRVWNYFEDFVDTIKYQDYLNKLGSFQGGMEIAQQIALAYMHAVETERALTVREIINPNYREKLTNEPREEIVPVRVTPHGVEKVSKDFDKEQTAYLDEFIEEQEQAMSASIANLQPHPRIFSLVNNVKLNRNSKKVGVSSHPAFDDDMEIVDFSESTTTRGRK